MFNKSERFAANGVQSKTRDADRVWLPAFEMQGVSISCVARP